jgi:fructuronate reductase
VTIPLSNAALSELRVRGVRTPNYDRRRIASGVVHFGPGAFHRVHQAYYFDELLQRDPRWGICEVALQSAGTRDALAPQDGLYALAILDAEPSVRIIGAIREILVARESSKAVLDKLADPAVHLVTATITEKGYYLTSQGGLDFSNAEIQRDLKTPDDPTTFIGYVVEGLRRRRRLRLAAPNIVSCDNLTGNGTRLRRATLEYAQELDVDLAKWIEGEVSFPRTMVDSITPATDDTLRARIAQEIGVDDRWPVQREAFTQWVIDDSLRGIKPDFVSVGVTVTDNVDGYEQAKLRLLNGAHTTLAYVGLLAGFETVAQAMNDSHLAKFVDALMKEIKPAVTAPKGLDVDAYTASLLKRFRNPALPHRLAQIAWDGSQKIPYRLLGTIRDNLNSGRSIEHLSYSVAAWFHFVRRRALRNEPPVDPLAKQLCEIGSQNGSMGSDDAPAAVNRFLALREVFPAHLQTDTLRTSLIAAYRRLSTLRDSADLPSTLPGAS